MYSDARERATPMLAERNAPWAFFSVRAKPAEETAFLVSPPPALAAMASMAWHARTHACARFPTPHLACY